MRLTVTVKFAGDEKELVCRTRDVSNTGLFLETDAHRRPGTPVELTLLDDVQGEVIGLHGVVTRAVEHTPGGSPGGLGVRLTSVNRPWSGLVGRAQRQARERAAVPQRRLRVLVVADEGARRGALALYVTSGWDVRFASDLAGTEEALRGFRTDAVIAEHDLSDERWAQILEAARRLQPTARRIVRAALMGEPAPAAGQPDDLVHRVVDLEAGLEAVLDALTAD